MIEITVQALLLCTYVDVVDTTAKIYIGDCYTCAQGHRFMCSSPDKITRISGGALSSKDNANKLLTMDMPLYTSCPKG